MLQVLVLITLYHSKQTKLSCASFELKKSQLSVVQSNFTQMMLPVQS